MTLKIIDLLEKAIPDKKRREKTIRFFKVMGVMMSFFMLIFALNMKTVDGAVYNTTNLTNADNLYDQTVALNSILKGWVGMSMLLTITVITFVSIQFTSRNNVLASLSGSSFIAILSSSILLPLELISLNTYTIVLVVSALSIFLSIVISRN